MKLNLELYQKLIEHIIIEFYAKKISKTDIIKDWNPTQYKLDIIKFSYDGFQEIYWMDSDTAIYADVTTRLSALCLSVHVFYLILDHVMYDESFFEKMA